MCASGTLRGGRFSLRPEIWAPYQSESSIINYKIHVIWMCDWKKSCVKNAVRGQFGAISVDLCFFLKPEQGVHGCDATCRFVVSAVSQSNHISNLSHWTWKVLQSKCFRKIIFQFKNHNNLASSLVVFF